MGFARYPRSANKKSSQNLTQTQLAPLKQVTRDENLKNNGFGKKYKTEDVFCHELQVSTETFCSQTNIYSGNMKNNFHSDICNQQVKIRRYRKFQSDRKCLAFGSTPGIFELLVGILELLTTFTGLCSYPQFRNCSVILQDQNFSSRTKRNENLIAIAFNSRDGTVITSILKINLYL